MPVCAERMDFDHEDPAYLTDQLITCIGNKRSLLGFIGRAIESVKERIGRDRIDTLDLFSGSGVVSRLLKRHSRHHIANDLERYSETINHCYLANRSEIELRELKEIHSRLTSQLRDDRLVTGLIAANYAPLDDDDIQEDERVFYTSRNARFLDTARQLIGGLPPELQCFFLAPLLSQASIHANTAGVFKGFYKNKSTGIGQFGGSGGDALRRILGTITLPFPIFSNYECTYSVVRAAANELVADLPTVDLAYLDPPYNQHPYGSNYFMLNLLLEHREPPAVSRVSGIPSDWNRSEYYRRRSSLPAFVDLVSRLDARYLLISLNSEGFLGGDEVADELSRHGTLERFEKRYNVFRGARNLRQREIHVTEYLYLLEK